MRYLFFALILLIGSESFAAIESCAKIQNNHLKLKAHTENISFAERAGGQYQKKVVICNQRKCKTKNVSSKRKVYEPGHPQANRRGYVVYPDINVGEEYEKLTNVVRDLKNLAQNGICQAKLQADELEYIVKYKKGQILKDIFKFTSENKLESWTRLFKNGRVSSIDYISRVEHKTTSLLAF